MTFIDRRNIKGLNTISGKSKQDGNYLEDCQNVIYNINEDAIVPRNDVATSFYSNAAGLDNLYKSKSSLSAVSLNGIYTVKDGLYKIMFGSFVNVGGAYQFPSENNDYYTQRTAIAEHASGVMYLTNFDMRSYGANDSFAKYCGDGLYCAGIPEISNFIHMSMVTNISNLAIPSSNWDHVNNTFTTTQGIHGFRFTLTTSGTLPSGLNTTTQYFAVQISSNTYKLSFCSPHSRQDSFAEVDFTSNGTGTHTLNFVQMQSASGVSYAIQHAMVCANGEEIVSSLEQCSNFKNSSIPTGVNFSMLDLGFAKNSSVLQKYKSVFAVPEKNTNIVSSSNSYITINVKPGHTIAVGDYVYLFYSTSMISGVPSLLEKMAAFRVSDIGLYTITIENPNNLNVYTNASIISNNRFIVCADIGNTGVFREHTSIPFKIVTQNNSIFIYNTYTTMESKSIVLYDENKSYPPPKATAITIYDDILVLGNCFIDNLQKGGSLCFSDVDSFYYHREKFDASYNEIEVGDASDGEIVGIINYQNDALYIFKRKAVYVLQGSLWQKNIRIDKISDGIGCISADSIQIFNRSIYFLAHDGIYRIIHGSYDIRKISSRINNLLISILHYLGISYTVPIRASSTVDKKNQRYYIYIKNLNKTEGLFLVYDIQTDSWWKWDLDCLGGMAGDDKIYFTDSNRYIKIMFELTGTSYIKKISTSWESVDRPEIQKKFKAIKLFLSNNSEKTGSINCKIFTDFSYTPSSIITLQLDGDTTLEIKPDGGTRQAKALKFELETYNNYKIESWSIEYEPQYFESKKF